MGRIRKIGSAHCNYSQILYQFLTFTQNLKRSPLLVVLAFKGHSVIIAAPIAALIAVLFSYGLKGHFMASYTITYMSGFANYAKNYFPIYLFGAVFAKLMDISGNAQSIAQFCTLKLGKAVPYFLLY